MGRGLTKEYHQSLNEDYVEGTMTCLDPATIKQITNTHFPNILNVEPTNACNLKCFYCPQDRAAKKTGFMDWNLYKRGPKY